MAFGITTINPYNTMLSIAKGDLRNIIWGGLIFDPGTHNPDDPTPTGNIMRMNVNYDSDGNRIADRMSVFFTGRRAGTNIFDAIVLDIDCAYPNDPGTGPNLNWTNEELCNFLIFNYFGTLDEGKQCYIEFDDENFESGYFQIRSSDEAGAEWGCHVTFGEDAELDEIIDNAQDNTNYNRTQNNPDWPLQELGIPHSGDEDVAYYGSSNVPRLLFNNYPTGQDSPGTNNFSMAIRGLSILESIELENGEQAYPDYHGEDGDSFLVECAVYRDPVSEQDFIIPDVFKSWHSLDYETPDPRCESRLVIEVYPNVGYIQDTMCWMTVRKVYNCVSGNVDNGFVYALYTDENNRENMPFIEGINHGPWNLIVDQNVDRDISEPADVWTPDGEDYWVTYPSPHNITGFDGDWWRWKTGELLGTINMEREEGGETEPYWDDANYPVASNEMRIYKVTDFMIDGTHFNDMAPEIQEQLDYPFVVAVDYSSKKQIGGGPDDWGYHMETTPDGFMQGLVLASVPEEIWEWWTSTEGAFEEWCSHFEDENGHWPTSIDMQDILVNMTYLPNVSGNENSEMREGYDENYGGWVAYARWNS